MENKEVHTSLKQGDVVEYVVREKGKGADEKEAAFVKHNDEKVGMS